MNFDKESKSAKSEEFFLVVVVVGGGGEGKKLLDSDWNKKTIGIRSFVGF